MYLLPHLLETKKPAVLREWPLTESQGLLLYPSPLTTTTTGLPSILTSRSGKDNLPKHDVLFPGGRRLSVVHKSGPVLD